MVEDTASLPELPPRFPELSGDMPLLPARMPNEYQYCPRLAYPESVQCEWVASLDTVEGTRAHRRDDRRYGNLPPAEVLDTGARYPSERALENIIVRVNVECGKKLQVPLHDIGSADFSADMTVIYISALSMARRNCIGPIQSRHL